MSNKERAEYYRYLKESVKAQDLLLSAEEKGMEKGMEKGREEGREKEKISTATAMLQDGESLEKIAKYTGLSNDEILKLKKKLESN